VIVAESAPQGDTRSVCIICTTVTGRRAGLSAIAECLVVILCSLICWWLRRLA